MKTRKQLKHEMLLTFIANTRFGKPKRRSAPIKPKFLNALMSFFI